METQKLSTVEKVGFGAGDMALNVVISSMMLIITFFYTDIYGLKTTDLALLFVAVKVVGAIADLVKTTLGPKGMDKILQSVRAHASSLPVRPATRRPDIWCSTARARALPRRASSSPSPSHLELLSSLARHARRFPIARLLPRSRRPTATSR